ncbi:MAG TPA: NAD(+)/NADH kinase [Abditibacteriaceae bacterium]|jgi:NAD+ kinase|nr:NAD(+)/NADH kinase [Abditibacteriaceae bacterium]
MRSLGIFAAPFKPQACELAARLVQLGEARGLRLRIEESCAQTINRPDLAGSDDQVARCEAVVVLSGDGGVLSAARAAAPHGTPILAVDLGRLGFLSTVRPGDLDKAFEQLLCDGFEVEERTMLEAQVLREGAPVSTAKPTAGLDAPSGERIIGLNDAVVAKSALARILELSIYVEGELVADVRADGLVISTPTGSTAYALSAGGPITTPDAPIFLICPICAHSLTQRPLVVGSHETIEVLAQWQGEEVSTEAIEAMLTVDGQIGVQLRSGDRVRVRRAPIVTRLMRSPGDSFYGRLREKMRWGH